MATLTSMINLGDLKKVIEIQRMESGTDEMGFQDEVWTTICTTRCKTEFDDRLMREIFRDEGIDSTTVKIFTFRYFKGLSTKDRIVFDGNVYEIYGFNNINDENRFIKVWGKMVCQ